MSENLKKALKYMSEEARRATFKKWVFKENVPCNADKMAQAGFIYTGTRADPDSVKCFFCQKSLDGWEETDDPFQEHLSHSKNCEFAKIQMPQCTLTLEEYLKLTECLVNQFIDKQLEKKIEEVEETYSEIEKKVTKMQKKA